MVAPMSILPAVIEELPHVFLRPPLDLIQAVAKADATAFIRHYLRDSNM